MDGLAGGLVTLHSELEELLQVTFQDVVTYLGEVPYLEVSLYKNNMFSY